MGVRNLPLWNRPGSGVAGWVVVGRFEAGWFVAGGFVVGVLVAGCVTVGWVCLDAGEAVLPRVAEDSAFVVSKTDDLLC